jgi:hypothetical protein
VYKLVRSTAAVIWVCVTIGCSGDGASILQYRPVDEAARSTALEAIRKKCDEIAASGKDKVAQNQAIAEHVRTYPDIAFASTSVDGVMALFYDGQPIIILNNVELGGFGSSTSPLRQIDEGRRTFSMPMGKPARLMNGFSSEFPADPGSTLAAILSKKGYAPIQTGASIEDFKKIGGDAVLHIRTHGGGGEVLDKSGNPVQEVDASGKPKEKDGKPVYSTLFGLWTTDVADAATIAAYRDDIINQRLVRMYEVISPCLFSFCQKKDWHLGITQDFVDKHWAQLAVNAYIHVSACSTAGGAVGNQALREKIMDKGIGSVYVGWSSPAVVADMDRVATYAIDRLSGANVLDTTDDPKEDPPQRPFDFQSVADKLGPRATSNGAKLTAFPDTGVSLDTFVLAPSIASLQPWDRDDALQLTGLFGDATVANTTITVGGSSCAFQPGGGTRGIMCKLDKAAKGDVVVTVNGHESNHVKLSSWRGKLNYAVESTQTGLSQVWTIDLHLRGDVGDYRDKPGEKPVAHQKVISMAKDSKISVVAAGNVASTDCTLTWTAKSFTVPPWGDLVVGQPGYTLSVAGVVDEGDAKNLWLELYGWAEPCYDRSVTAPKGGCSAVSTSGRCALPVSTELLASTATDPYHVGLMGRLAKAAVIGADGSIQAGQMTPATSICCGGELGVPWDYSQRVSWDAMSPEGGSGPDATKDER